MLNKIPAIAVLAMRNGLYTYNTNKEIVFISKDTIKYGKNNHILTFIYNKEMWYVKICDYRKTWGLKKEEVEIIKN